MTKNEFLKELKKNLNVTNKEADSKINSFWETFYEIVKKNRGLTIREFGTFKVKNVRSRKVVSPNGEFKTTASKKLAFKVSPKFKEKIK